MDSWAPLVPEDFLLSSRDLVPGVQRLTACSDSPSRRSHSSRAAGGARPTLGALGIASQLAPPRLHSVRAGVLTGLSVHLPEGFLDVVRKQASGCLWKQAGRGPAAQLGEGSAACGAGQADLAHRLIPLSELRQSLQLRVSVHNGRRFVGPSVQCPAPSLEGNGQRGELLGEPARACAQGQWAGSVGSALPYSVGLARGNEGGGRAMDARATYSLPSMPQCQPLWLLYSATGTFLRALLNACSLLPLHFPRAGQHTLTVAGGAHLAWLPADRFVVLVLELVLLQAGSGSAAMRLNQGNGSEVGSIGRETVLGWTAVAPFTWPDSSSEAMLAEGPHQVGWSATAAT